MTTEAELLRAVIAAPADDAARRIYADALQTAGDPRGEYIALALAGRQVAAATRAGEAAWAAALGPRVRRIRYDRGLPCDVVLDCADRSGPALDVLDRAPITCVELAAASDPDHAQVAKAAWPAVYGEIAAWFAADPRTARIAQLWLRSSDGAVDKWGEPAVRALFRADLRGLRRLAVWSGDGRQYLDAVISNPTITALDQLAVNGLGYLHGTFAWLAAWRGFASVTELVVVRGALGLADHEALAAGAYVGGLATLRLERNQVSDTGPEVVATLARSTQLSALRRLHVNGYQVDAALPLVGACVGLPALTELSVVDSDITDRGLAALADSPRLARLQRLELPICRAIGPAGAQALAAAPAAAGLRYLDLGYTNIGEAGARALADSPYLRGLDEIRANDDLHAVLAPAFGARYVMARTGP